MCCKTQASVGWAQENARVCVPCTVRVDLRANSPDVTEAELDRSRSNTVHMPQTAQRTRAWMSRQALTKEKIFTSRHTHTLGRGYSARVCRSIDHAKSPRCATAKPNTVSEPLGLAITLPRKNKPSTTTPQQYSTAASVPAAYLRCREMTLRLQSPRAKEAADSINTLDFRLRIRSQGILGGPS